ncbi:MAG: hypothetical protein NT170_00025 [Candidatus Moranbacteria bacterium]|nr:hypothetical protein [Candidatus Moranbacteria bacterium]
MVTSAWELFKKDFQKGQFVVIITEDDRLDWGLLHFDEVDVGMLTLASGLRPARTYHWNQIIFMAHGGFPVRKIFGKYPEKDLITTEDVPGLFRAALAQENLEALQQKADAARVILGIDLKEIAPNFATTRAEMRDEERYFKDDLFRLKFGDPFEVEACHMRLFNAGNIGPRFYLNPAEEILRMMSKDGAIAHLWQIINVFEVEIVRP